MIILQIITADIERFYLSTGNPPKEVKVFKRDYLDLRSEAFARSNGQIILPVDVEEVKDFKILGVKVSFIDSCV